MERINWIAWQRDDKFSLNIYEINMFNVALMSWHFHSIWIDDKSRFQFWGWIILIFLWVDIELMFVAGIENKNY